jgi:predicted phosphodiesterase
MRPYAQKQSARVRDYEDRFYEDDVVVSKNVLVIGDTHIPYEKKGYLEFCMAQYKKYNCDTVVHIGDLIDSHATSFHPSMPDAYSAGDELKYSIKKLRKWYKAFPNMKVVIGNHDMRAYRLASDSRIASKWINGYADVLEVPNWTFEESYEINGTTYTHGTGTSGVTAAYRRMLNLGQNVVIGHLHSEASIIFHKMPNTTLWGMCVGCGVDEKSYGMNYAKNFPKKSIISCGVVLDKQPIINIMQ